MIDTNAIAIKKFTNRMSNRGRATSTILYYTYLLNDFFNAIDKSYTDITLDDIDAYISQKREKEIARRKVLNGKGVGAISKGNAGEFKSSTLNTIYSTLRSFFKTLDIHALANNIQLAKSSPWTPAILDMNLIKRIINKDYVVVSYRDRHSPDSKRQEDPFYADRDHLLINFIISTGFRRTETSNLKHSDLKLDRKIQVVETKGKGGKIRAVELSHHWIRLYENFNKSYPVKSEYVFFTKNGGKLSVFQVAYVVRAVSRSLGIGDIIGIGPHKLRHAYITVLVEAGEELTKVQRNAGHSNINMTARYKDLVKTNKDSMQNPLDILQNDENDKE